MGFSSVPGLFEESRFCLLISVGWLDGLVCAIGCEASATYFNDDLNCDVSALVIFEDGRSEDGMKTIVQSVWQAKEGRITACASPHFHSA